MAEVLIALLIIGVVAAMTLPTLFHNISERKNATKVAVFNTKFIQGLNLAKNAGDMSNQFSSTYDFLKNGLSKHIRMSTICDSSNLKDCMGYDKITYDNGGKDDTVEVSTLTRPVKLNIKDKNFKDVAAFVMSDGTPVILSYNINCTEDNGINSSISLCVAGLFDLNGSQAPNMFKNKIKTGKTAEIGDIRSFNGASINGCTAFIDDMCIKSPIVMDTETYMDAYGGIYAAIKSADPDYVRPGFLWGDNRWQMAQDYCTKVKGGHIPDANELAKIATALYGVKVSGKSSISAPMKNKDSIYQILGIPTTTTDFTLWSTEEKSDTFACYRIFNSTGTRWECEGKYDGYKPLCIGN